MMNELRRLLASFGLNWIRLWTPKTDVETMKSIRVMIIAMMADDKARGIDVDYYKVSRKAKEK